jgi:hypothetical protein
MLGLGVGLAVGFGVGGIVGAGVAGEPTRMRAVATPDHDTPSNAR